MAEVVDDMKNERRKRTRVNDSNEEDDREESSDIKEGSEEEEDIWLGWEKLLKGLQECVALPFLSPENHDIIWCSIELRRRPLFSTNMYDRLNNENTDIPLQVVDTPFQSLVSEAADAADTRGFSNAIENLRSFDTTTTTTTTNTTQSAEKHLITNSLELILELYQGAGKTLSSSEGCLRFYVVDPLLKNCNRFLLEHGRSVTFYPGEIELNAMTIQLRNQGITDGRLKYNADGKIYVDELSTEILLSEVSSSFDENTRRKTSFDHYKAMFGQLAMLRTIAGLYQCASFETFSKLKLHFIHTHNRAIRHWTMSTPAPGLYIMNKQSRIDIIKDFEKKQNSLVSFINFNITLGVALEETLNTLSSLKQEHDEKQRSLRFARDVTETSLLDHVHPQIVRLNENKHMAQLADDVPKSPVYILNP